MRKREGQSGTLLTRLSGRAKYKCLEEQSCREVIQRHRWEVFAGHLHAPTPLLSCFMVLARNFCFKRLIVVGSELEVRSFSVFHQMSLMR